MVNLSHCYSKVMGSKQVNSPWSRLESTRCPSGGFRWSRSPTMSRRKPDLIKKCQNCNFIFFLQETAPHNSEFVGLNSAVCWAFFFDFLSCPTFLQQWSLFNQVPQGGAALIMS